jgi:hypothetical protein
LRAWQQVTILLAGQNYNLSVTAAGPASFAAILLAVLQRHPPFQPKAPLIKRLLDAQNYNLRAMWIVLVDLR